MTERPLLGGRFKVSDDRSMQREYAMFLGQALGALVSDMSEPEKESPALRRPRFDTFPAHQTPENENSMTRG